jgi:hypothetical protein
MNIIALVQQLLNIQQHNNASTTFPLLTLAPVSDVSLSLLHTMHHHQLLHILDHRCIFVYADGHQCDQIMELLPSNIYKVDHYALQCPTHGGSISIRRGSFFAGRRLPLSQLLYIFHLLSCGTSITSVTKFFHSVKLHRHSVSRMLTCLQEKMWCVLRSRHMPTFTPADELEIDEMWLDWTAWDEREGIDNRFHAWESGMWIIGLVNRAGTKLWIECIPNRKRSSIEKVVDPMLKSWLFRKPRIYTDALKSYEYLKYENTHYIINKERDGFAIHETTFWGHCVNVHVNHIESTWKQLRKHLAMRHAYNSPKHVQLHIAEFVYNWYKLDWYDLIKF